jgi:hypothetical protein
MYVRIPTVIAVATSLEVKNHTNDMTCNTVYIKYLQC